MLCCKVGFHKYCIVMHGFECSNENEGFLVVWKGGWGRNGLGDRVREWVGNRVVTIRYPHNTIRIAILESRNDTYRDTC